MEHDPADWIHYPISLCCSHAHLTLDFALLMIMSDQSGKEVTDESTDIPTHTPKGSFILE